ncbi:hypothetical protein PIB30_058317 [Stylosanthes scabra]|uniref:Uncharacterized protein n=1 Tax=Stylosanthes scabra TaxID=79078 RepID=A0ABU6UMB3_9FABA|nr:hypothetical protein [Stylosanthes scabra]
MRGKNRCTRPGLRRTSSHVDSFIPQTQEHTGLDELFHMTSCPSAKFTSVVESFRVSQAQHVDHASSSSAAPPSPPPPAFDVQHGQWIPTYSSPPVMGFPVFDPSRIGLEYATPLSYQAPSSYHSHSFDRHSAPTSSMTHPAPDPSASDTPAANPPPPPPPPPGRLHRGTKPPPCGTGVTFIQAATDGSRVCYELFNFKKIFSDPIPGSTIPELG